MNVSTLFQLPNFWKDLSDFWSEMTAYEPAPVQNTQEVIQGLRIEIAELKAEIVAVSSAKEKVVLALKEQRQLQKKYEWYTTPEGVFALHTLIYNYNKSLDLLAQAVRNLQQQLDNLS